MYTDKITANDNVLLKIGFLEFARGRHSKLYTATCSSNGLKPRAPSEFLTIKGLGTKNKFGFISEGLQVPALSYERTLPALPCIISLK